MQAKQKFLMVFQGFDFKDMTLKRNQKFEMGTIGWV